MRTANALMFFFGSVRVAPSEHLPVGSGAVDSITKSMESNGLFSAKEVKPNELNSKSEILSAFITAILTKGW